MPRQKRDPLIAAMIAKLPDGGEWPVDAQFAWLRFMAMAFGPVYGGDVAARFWPKSDHVDVQSLIPPAIKPNDRLVIEPKRPQHRFYIDEEGNALNKHGKPINAKDVQGELVDLRGQDGDMKTIRWADGTMGLNGADLTIVAA